MEKQKLQAIFFDFDGVIVDSVTTKTAAFRTLFSDYPEDIVTGIIAYHRRHGGISRVEKIRYAHQHFMHRPLTEKELTAWSARFSDLVVTEVINAAWIAGAKDFLDRFSTALPIFVISGTPQEELRYIIDRRSMSGYFREILGSPVKKPAHIKDLLATYQLMPERCVFVGDALTDFNAAKETGLHFIGIQGEVDFPAGTTVLPDCRDLQRVISELFR